MAGFRSYFDFSKTNTISTGDILQLSTDESRHLCGSLRAKIGDKVDLFDLKGCVFSCEITNDNTKKTSVKVLSKIEIIPRKYEITIAQCLPKGKVFDEIIRRAVEIGASAIIPIISDRCQVKIDNKAKKLEKWNIDVIEAIKQSANFFKFDIEEPVSFKNFISNCDRFDTKIVASLQDTTVPILQILQDAKNPEKICILIGPEGDISPREYELANSVKFQPVSLGDNVLKSETASIYSLSAVSAYMQLKK